MVRPTCLAMMCTDLARINGFCPVKGDRPGGPADALVRPENLRLAAGGSGIVTIATFPGSLTRVSVLLSGDLTVQADVPSTEAPAPGTAVEVSLAEVPVLVTTHR